MFARPVPVLGLVSLFAGAAVFPPVLPAQDSSARGPVPDAPRTLRFSTDEGTWMSLDVSPDGKTIVFDLLGDLYTLPIAGGTATRITEGPTWDSHPKFSPDGKRIAFVSDRSAKGHREIYIMDANGKHVVRVTHTPRNSWSTEPDWQPISPK